MAFEILSHSANTPDKLLAALASVSPDIALANAYNQAKASGVNLGRHGISSPESGFLAAPNTKFGANQLGS